MLLNLPYRREEAALYAEKWAFRRNGQYYNFDPLGGDCTNFVSQCLYAGSGVMNYTPTFGWYYISLRDRSPSWTGVRYLWDFLLANEGAGPYGRETAVGGLDIGDLIQLSDGSEFYHSLLVTGFSGGEPLVAAHTVDAYMRPLGAYRFQGARFCHILGVRRWG